MTEHEWTDESAARVRSALEATASTLHPVPEWDEVVRRAAATGPGSEPSDGSAARRPRRWLVAAAVLAVAAAGTATVVRLSGRDDVVATRIDSSTTTPTTAVPTTMVTPTTALPPTSEGAATEPPPVGPPDLEPPAAGREITFDGIGDVRVGQTLEPEQVTTDFPGSGCGYWPDGEMLRSADPPPTALVDSTDPARPTVSAVHLRNNPSYRTASGVGIGTSLASLERIYGDRLVIDAADGWEQPTDGLLARYQPVAAVRDGDRAITYTLSGLEDPSSATVQAVKVSDAAYWGDDEGCA